MHASRKTGKARQERRRSIGAPLIIRWSPCESDRIADRIISAREGRRLPHEDSLYKTHPRCTCLWLLVSNERNGLGCPQWGVREPARDATVIVFFSGAVLNKLAMIEKTRMKHLAAPNLCDKCHTDAANRSSLETVLLREITLCYISGLHLVVRTRTVKFIARPMG